ncbi:amidase [Parafilimonas terrae]|uniref:Amidase n=1 Tax=Parafilimonas terrae TaxID=1465490 RepID=A0A1I5REP2_9BACT|nr:amidase [Parafilimonas terrae]SFP57024.1 amidase [Parafilimonas terrae]
MQRRNFLKHTSVAGLVFSPVFKTSSSIVAEKSTPEKNIDDFELNEATIDMLQQAMQAGKYTSRKITELYLKRIEAIDKNGPELNAVIEINPDALKIADAMDAERKAGKIRGPMHGIPVLIKDNINTGDKMMTTAGALALQGNYAAKDAFIIQQLRASGAVLLGKTNLSEWANFRSTHSSSGWSSRGKQTRCPYILERSPSGSSSGSGAAVAANLCAVAIGTETDGSIVSPSSVNGIVGIKPTVGLLSRSGIIPISATQDTAGPMARTVKDAAILLGALTNVDEEDAVTKNSMGKAQKDYTVYLKEDALKGKRIGIEKAFFNGSKQVVDVYKTAVDVLKQQGAIIVEIELKKALSDLGDAEFTVLQYEFKDGVNKYLSAANAKVKTLKEVIDFNKQHEAEAMPFFKQEILEMCEAKGDLNSGEYKEALYKNLSSRLIIDNMISGHKLDAICGVTNGLSWCIDLINGDYDTGFSFSTPAAISGYPHITVPMGMVHHLPIGLSFIGGAYTESQLISLAYSFEQATKKRIAPTFIANSISMQA